MNTVLIFDDDPLLLKMLHKALNLLGFEAQTAHTPSEVLELLQKRRFDAVIAEVFFNAGNGLGLLRQIRDACPEMRIVALTGGSGVAVDSTDTETIRRHGADFVLHKPVEMQMLERCLDRLHERRTLTEDGYGNYSRS